MRKLLFPRDEITNIVIPYKASLFEEYLEKKLIEVRRPLKEAYFMADEPFRLIRESTKNRLGDRIEYWAEYGYLDNYADMEDRIIIDEKLLKRLTEEPEFVRFACGGSTLFVHDANKSKFNVDLDNWDLTIEGKCVGKYIRLWNWQDFKKFIDEVVKVFASGKYDNKNK